MCADLGHVLLSGGRYVDDNEIVLSLKKMDTDLKWPALLEGWASLTTGVSELMKGTSVYVIGASITINWAVAKELATGLGYVVFSFHLLAVLSVYTYLFVGWQYEVVHVFEGGSIRSV
jgi:hypothetical protein